METITGGKLRGAGVLGFLHHRSDVKDTVVTTVVCGIVLRALHNLLIL